MISCCCWSVVVKIGILHISNMEGADAELKLLACFISRSSGSAVTLYENFAHM